MAPLISLVITTYNHAQFLGQAIESVLQQTYPHFELLIWDDGSTDNSVALAQTYAQGDNRVKVIAAEHEGRFLALSKAIAQTKGPYLGWIDSDDLLASTALEETVNVLNACPAVGMVYTDYYDMDETGQLIAYGHRCRIPYSPQRLLVDFMTFHFRLMRRSTYEDAGGINGAYDVAEDYDFCLRASEVTQIQRVSKPLYYYRIHSKSLSQQFTQKQTLNSYNAVKQALKRRGLTSTHTIDLDLASGCFTLRQISVTCPSLPRIATRLATKFVPLLASIPLAGALQGGVAFAQSIAPATDGTNTVVTPTVNQFNITGGTFSRDGANLFHSFERFGLTQGQIANFLANPQLQNILGRVVGNNPSVIDGLIQVTGGTPNLYLLNPAGIVFGPNASLNVPSSFTATTANTIGFGCGPSGVECQWFSATGENNFSSLVGNPNGLMFNTLQPGAIANAGNLAVTTGKTLALIGGTVVNTGQLSAPDGQVLISAAPGGTFARLTQPGSLLSLEFQPVALDSSSTLAPTLAQLLTGGNLANATGLTVNPNGTVALTGSNTTIPTTPGTAIVSGSLNTAGQTGGAIAIVGQQVGLLGASLDASGTNAGGQVYIGGNYQGKGSLPTASQTYISQDSVIDASAKQSGQGGTVIVWADNSTNFRGTIRATGGAVSGDGGFIEVSGKETLQYRGTADTTAANGRSGTLLLDPLNIRIVTDDVAANDSEVNDGAILFADGAGADFTISQSALQDAAASGNNIVLQATNAITFDPLTDGGLFLFSEGEPGSFTLQAGGAITMNPTDTIFAPAWNVTIQGGSLSLGSIDTSDGNFNDGGNITLQAQGNILAGTLFSNSGFASDGITTGGAIAVTSSAGGISVGTISATGSSFGGNGGSITLQAQNNIQAGNLSTNGGFGFNGPTRSGPISVTSNAGTIAVGAISATGVAGSLGGEGGESDGGFGNTVTLRTITNGGDISFQTIDTQGIGYGTSGGNVNILARGQVRGTGTLRFGETIATQGGDTGTNGLIRIEHDGGPTNQPFIVGAADITPTSGNGTVGALRASTFDTVSSGTFPFSSSPFTSSGGQIQITFLNDPPTINGVGALPSTVTNQPLNFTFAALGISTADVNADNPLFIRVAFIQPGATLLVNGVSAVPGTLIPSDATLQYTPPAGFTGLLENAFSITVDDVITTSAPRAIALQVASEVIPDVPDVPPDVPNVPDVPPAEDIIDSPCTLTNCNSITEPPITVANPDPGEVLVPDLPEDRFSNSFTDYLGVEPVVPSSVEEQRGIAQQIEQDTGEKPAFIYVSFVPASLKVTSSTDLDATSSAVPIAVGQNLANVSEQESDQLEVIVVTAKGSILRKRTAAATRVQVMQLADELRREVADPRRTRSTNYLSRSQQLYQWLIAPIQTELRRRQITNLVFLMDAGLRSLPVAALHDGQRFLVEQYSIGLMPSVSLTDTRYQNIKNSQLLSLGISESTQGQLPLPSVQIETATIVNSLWSGQLYLNENATIDTLRTARQQRPYGIIHLATHADFLPGKLDNSYIQFWEERLRLDQLRELGWSNPQVQLLVLSACSTALGDREAELGFGGLAVQAGVKSAVASLWAVNDVATAALVTRFYKDLGAAPIKAEALRQAQLAALRGQVYVKDGKIEGIDSTGIALPDDVSSVRDETLTHPYYWSGFTMIGNPW